MRSDRDRLLDMVEMCELLLRHAGDRSDLAENPVIQAAAQRWIEVLGEAATHVSEATREQHPEIPWRDIIGMRTILAHAYFHVDQDVVGSVVERHLPDLSENLRRILDEVDGHG